jgi:hypothetical protein
MLPSSGHRWSLLTNPEETEKRSRVMSGGKVTPQPIEQHRQA